MKLKYAIGLIILNSIFTSAVYCSPSQMVLRGLNKVNIASFIRQNLRDMNKNLLGGPKQCFDPRVLANNIACKVNQDPGFLNLSDGVYDIDLDSPNQAEAYSKYVIYNSNITTLPFSLALIVLGPRQGTCIHDHKVECAPVVLKGQMKHLKYRQLPACEEIHAENLKHLGEEDYSFEPCLELEEEVIMDVGDTDYLVPFQEVNSDTHRIVNNADETSISMHLYLFDASKKIIDQQGKLSNDTSVKNHFELYEVK